MIVTKEEATAKNCVLDTQIACAADQCMAWRWKPSLSVNNPSRLPGGAGQTINKTRGLLRLGWEAGVLLTEKRCTKCGETKPSKAFSPRPKVRSGLSSWCRKCLCNHINNKLNPKKRREQKERLIKYMGGKCIGCGGRFPFYVYDLHHRDPSKKELKMTDLNDKRWDRVLAEAEKCDLLCANCHRIAHHSAKHGLLAGKPECA